MNASRHSEYLRMQELRVDLPEWELAGAVAVEGARTEAEVLAISAKVRLALAMLSDPRSSVHLVVESASRAKGLVSCHDQMQWLVGGGRDRSPVELLHSGRIASAEALAAWHDDAGNAQEGRIAEEPLGGDRNG